MDDDLHGWCYPCQKRIDDEDVLDHASREHITRVDLDVCADGFMLLGFGSVVLVDAP